MTLVKNRSLLVKQTINDEETEMWATPAPANIEYEAVRFIASDAQETDPAETSPQHQVNFFVMGAELWRELGSPEIISLTVEAGDLLND